MSDNKSCKTCEYGCYLPGWSHLNICGLIRANECGPEHLLYKKSTYHSDHTSSKKGAFSAPPGTQSPKANSQ